MTTVPVAAAAMHRRNYGDPVVLREGTNTEFRNLVQRALAGDDAAWERLVERLSGVAWRAISGLRLPEEDRKDAFASSFHRLFEKLGTIRDPEKLPGWMATTARNEALTILRRRQRVEPRDDIATLQSPTEAGPEDEMLGGDLRSSLQKAFQRLSPAHQDLIRLLTADPRPSYEEIQVILGMPHGSIGPTRQRCLAQLRGAPELRPYLEGRQP